MCPIPLLPSQALDDPIADALAPMLAEAARRHTSTPFAQAAPAPAPVPQQPTVAPAPSAPQPQQPLPQTLLASPPCTLLYGGSDLTLEAAWVVAAQAQLRSRLQRFDLALA